MKKQIINRTTLTFSPDFPGLQGVNIMGREYPIEPYLVFTEFLMDRQVFGPHPHAGVSVITYMLPDSLESFINRDSNGDFSTIEPGGYHITQAGSGIHHDEFPRVTGIETHGFQIWVNHTEANRFVAPKAMHAKAHQVPEKVTDAYRVRVIHGRFDDTTSMHQMVTDVGLLHVFLQPNATITFNLRAEEIAFSYGLKGEGQSVDKRLSGQTILNYSSGGNVVDVTAFDEGLEFIFAFGQPLNEPITYGGPFVMTTPAQMALTRQRYAAGEMGTLPPYKS